MTSRKYEISLMLVELIAKGGWMESFYNHKVDWFFYTILPIFSSEFLGRMLRPHQSFVTASVTVGFILWEYTNNRGRILADFHDISDNPSTW